MSGKTPEGKSALDRREALRRLVAGAGVAGAAATLPAIVPCGRAVAGTEAPSASHMPMAAEQASGAAAPGMAFGAAEPPDPSLSAAGWKPKFLDDHQAATVLALGDLLIPETDTPGARAAQVDRFIDLLLSTEAPGTGENAGNDLTDLLLHKGSMEARKRYVEALSWLDGHCLAHHSLPFIAMDRPDQETVLALLTNPTEDKELARGRELFSLIKGAVVMAYYSSEIGALQELKYQTNPYQTGMPGCEHPESK